MSILTFIGLVVGGFFLYKIYFTKKIIGDLERAEGINKMLVGNQYKRFRSGDLLQSEEQQH